ncbi:hypothetical protein T06_13814 [Trichinella sp. T6]|nr:hypothetical protein T06_13814 [Trichinella sp. T6]
MQQQQQQQKAIIREILFFLFISFTPDMNRIITTVEGQACYIYFVKERNCKRCEVQSSVYHFKQTILAADLTRLSASCRLYFNRCFN